MRFLVKFVLLVSVHKDIDFFSMYEEGFLLVRTNSIEGALAYLKGGAPIDAVILEAASGYQRTADLCLTVKKSKPAAKIVVLDNAEAANSTSFPADAILAESATDTQLAATLLQAMVEPQTRESWFKEPPKTYAADVSAVMPSAVPERAYLRG